MIYVIEKRRKDPRGNRMWRPTSQAFEIKAQADNVCEQLNDSANNDIHEYTVTEKPD